MTVPPTYPGIFVEEIAGGARPIAGVPTAITAFIGAALRGPVDVPVAIASIAEYERTFGALAAACPMGHAVHQFFENGGTDALVVRVVNGASTATGAAGALALEAASPGAWGNRLRVRVDHVLPATAVGPRLFTLTVRDTMTGVTEVFRDLSVVRRHARFVGTVLAQESTLVRLRGAPPRGRPAATPVAAPGVDPLTVMPGSIPFSTDGTDGAAITDAQVSAPELQVAQRGLWALDRAPRVNLLCIPPFTRDAGGDIGAATRVAAVAYCRSRRALFIADPPASWRSTADVIAGLSDAAWGLPHSADVTLYFPRILAPDPLQPGQPVPFAPCGAIAGVMARMDRERGVWVAPAGRGATLRGVSGVTVPLTEGDQQRLNPIAVNCLRQFPGTPWLVYGARTLAGADALGSEWKYVNVRRFALFVEESIDAGTRWALFEPNGEALWARLRQAVDDFLMNLFRQGALAGATLREACFVRCDRTTMTQAEIDGGIVTLVVGIAPLKPAEFVTLTVRLSVAQAVTAVAGPASRRDPYAAFNFRLRWDGRTVAAVSRASGLRHDVMPVDHREGTSPTHRSAAATLRKHDVITLERGVTHDDGFAAWVGALVSGDPSGTAVRDLELDVLDEAGTTVVTYLLRGCRAVRFDGPAGPAAPVGAVVIESMALQCAGVERLR